MKLNWTAAPTAALLMWTTAQAGTVPVTSTADSGAGSLRAALASAADGDTIDATGISGTILLTSGELSVASSVTILGPVTRILAVNGNFPTTTNRVFHVLPGKTVSISSLDIINGATPVPKRPGAGIWNDHSALTVYNCIVSGNTCVDGAGGGIFNDARSSGRATLTILFSVISSNSGLTGGGIESDGFSGGSAELTVEHSTISGNRAANGGGIKNSGSSKLTMRDCKIIGNSATLNDGGGVYNVGGADGAVLTVVDSRFHLNSARGRGGAIYNSGINTGSVMLAVNSCEVSSNSALLGGGIYNNGENGGHALLLITNSTVSGNVATNVGGIFNDGGVLGSGESAGTATLSVIASTFTGNSADGRGFPGVAIYNDSSAGGSATVEIGNTILNAGASGQTIANNSGVITSDGYNLSSDAGGGFLTATGDQTSTDPMLGPLQENGATFMHALRVGSPAIDKGKSFGVTTDQRGEPRPYDSPNVPNATSGDGSDIGAYEAAEPRVAAAQKTGDDLQLSFTSWLGTNYEVQSRSDLRTGNWTPLAGTIAGNGGIASTTVSNAFNQPQQFFRIHAVP